MSLPTTFTPDEQKMLYSTALEVGLAVMRASESGFQGTVAELDAMINAPLDLAREYPNNSIIQSILPNEEEPGAEASAPDTEDGEWVEETAREVERDALIMCRDAANLVEMKADPSEGLEYKRWLVQIAESVAGASPEKRHFWQREKPPVSEAEAAVIHDIAEALRLPL
jgi:hypothetical protein